MLLKQEKTVEQEFFDNKRLEAKLGKLFRRLMPICPSFSVTKITLSYRRCFCQIHL